MIKDAVDPSCDHRDVKANVYAFPFLNSNVYIQVVYTSFCTWFSLDGASWRTFLSILRASFFFFLT